MTIWGHVRLARPADEEDIVAVDTHIWKYNYYIWIGTCLHM